MEFVAGDDKESMRRRGLSYDAVLAAPILAVEENPSRPGQLLLVVEIDGYAVAALRALGTDRWLIATAYFSRKHTRKYLP